MRLARLGVTLGLAVTLLSSCAYYNTFYLARKYYFKATNGMPYEVDREGTTQRPNYNKSADYSKKLLGVYPKSKWVDDAWMLWAAALVGTDDPLKAIAMLEEFQVRFPKSELRPDAEFFLGLACRAARKHEQSVEHFEAFLNMRPKDDLTPYAYYERAKALMSLERYQEAAASAGQVLQRWPGHVLADRALRQRAEARYQQHAWQQAREDFQAIGARALNDDDRLLYLLREVDCLEASRDYDAARQLLADARSHVPPPPPVPQAMRTGSTGAGTPPPAQTYVANQPGADRYGRLTLRMGGVELLAGHTSEAVDLYQTVLQDYPRSPLAAEAQYRIGYAYETGADDFARATTEYAKVKEQTGTSQFSQQAQQRMDNLDRIQKYRTATGADSAEKQSEASFLVAEHYLFNLERPDRAVEQYRAIAESSSTPAVKARAMNAEAWVLSRKLKRKESADSLFWKVVRDFPETEAQLAARDYLEAEGQKVDEKLIVPPKGLVLPPPVAEEEPLTQPPASTPALGSAPVEAGGQLGPNSSAAALGAATTAGSASLHSGTPQSYRYAQLPDSVRQAMATRDSVLRVAAQDTSPAGKAHADSLRRAYAQADTAGRAAQMAAIQRSVPAAAGVVMAPGGGTAPNLASGTEGAVRSPSSMSTQANAPAKSAVLPGALAIEGGAAVKPDSTRDAAADTTQRGLSPGAAAATAAVGATAVKSTTTTTSPSSASATATHAPATQAAVAPKPPKAQGGPISSLWVTQTKAERDSVKHAKAVEDSTKKADKAAKKAQQEAEKAAAKAQKQAAADSAKAGKR
jgi:tetratricopeptide (TPR) repeat protein